MTCDMTCHAHAHAHVHVHAGDGPPLQPRPRERCPSRSSLRIWSQESPACDLSANVFRDPHINFAHGGSADLRGQHGALYNFLSAPGLSVNVKIEETIFTLHQGSLTVNGTFLTEAHLVARMSPQKHATASFWASELDPNNFGWQTVNGTCVGRPFRFGNRGHKNCFGLEIAMQCEISHG